MHAFRISPETGDLIFPQLGITIGRLGEWERLPEQLRSLVGPCRDLRTGWIWRTVTPLDFEDYPVGMMLGYHRNSLEMLYFSLLPVVDRNAWPSEEECIEEVKVLREAMEKQLGARLTDKGAAFSWGTAYCSYDPKGGFASAGLNYGV